jgi:hypothetical protein
MPHRAFMQETIVQQGHHIEQLEGMNKKPKGSPVFTSGTSEVEEALAAERKQREMIEAAKVQLQVRLAAVPVPPPSNGFARPVLFRNLPLSNVSWPFRVIMPVHRRLRNWRCLARTCLEFTKQQRRYSM